MKKIHHQFQEATRHVVLETHEKSLMRERLVTYMSYRPLRHVPYSTIAHLLKTRGILPAPIFSYFRARHVSGALTIALLVTTSMVGVSSAATSALPGDILYPVKVNINEEMHGVLITSSEARVAWEQERAERRLDEAGQLAAAGKLDAKKQAQVSRLFSTQATKVFTHVREIKQTDPVLAMEMSDEIEQAFDTHEETLARVLVERNAKEDRTVARELVAHVRQVANEAGELRATAELAIVGTTTDPLFGREGHSEHDDTFQENADESVGATSDLRERAAYRAQERATQLGTAATTAITSLEAPSELLTQAYRGMDQASTLMVKGEEALTRKQYVAAYRTYREASSVFAKMVRLVKTNHSYEVKVPVETVASKIIETAALPGSSVNTWEEAIVGATTTETEYETTDALYAQATELLAQARLAVQHASSTITEDIVKEAAAYLLRGEASLSSGGNDEETRALFSHTYELAHRAIGAATTSAPSVAPTSNAAADGDSASNSPTETIPTAVRVLLEPVPENEPLIRGSVLIPGWCGEITATATPLGREADSPGVALVLATSGEPRACAAESFRMFEIMVFGQQANVLQTILNGVPVSWEVSTNTIQSPPPAIEATDARGESLF